VKDHFNWIVGAVLCCVFGSVSAQEKPDIRAFTRSSDGKTLDAFVVAHDGQQVTIQVAGRKQFTLEPSVFSEEDQVYLKNWLLKSKGMPALGELDERVKPGATFRVHLPEWEKTKQGSPGGFSLSIPKDYQYPEPVPLLVFLQGGKGSDKLNRVPPIVDKTKYLVAAFPFPKSLSYNEPVANAPRDQLLAIEAYHTEFLEELRRLVPNISMSHRFIAGSSNGAHTIGSALVMDWEAYTEYFRGFILWEGGGCSVGNDYRAARGKDKVLWLGWGEKSEFKDYAKARGKEIEDARAEITLEGIADAKHGPSANTWKAVKQWIDTTAEEKLSEMEFDSDEE